MGARYNERVTGIRIEYEAGKGAMGGIKNIHECFSYL